MVDWVDNKSLQIRFPLLKKRRKRLFALTDKRRFYTRVLKISVCLLVVFFFRWFKIFRFIVCSLYFCFKQNNIPQDSNIFNRAWVKYAKNMLPLPCIGKNYSKTTWGSVKIVVVHTGLQKNSWHFPFTKDRSFVNSS